MKDILKSLKFQEIFDTFEINFQGMRMKYQNMADEVKMLQLVNLYKINLCTIDNI